MRLQLLHEEKEARRQRIALAKDGSDGPHGTDGDSDNVNEDDDDDDSEDKTRGPYIFGTHAHQWQTISMLFKKMAMVGLLAAGLRYIRNVVDMYAKQKIAQSTADRRLDMMKKMNEEKKKQKERDAAVAGLQTLINDSKPTEVTILTEEDEALTTNPATIVSRSGGRAAKLGNVDEEEEDEGVPESGENEKKMA